MLSLDPYSSGAHPGKLNAELKI